MTDNQKHRHRRRSIVLTYLLYKKTQRHVPPFVRGLAGVILMILGALGFLPIIGFWMIPLGLAVLATDIPPLSRWIRKKLALQRHKHRSIR